MSCVFQRTRPAHTSTEADILPFRSKDALNHVFDGLRLPSSYFQVADGSPTTCHHHILVEKDIPRRYEFVGHWVTKTGDWSLALAHHAETMETSVFWSMNEKMESGALLGDLLANKNNAFHPMLIPCIMFAHVFEMSLDRRNKIKDELKNLESAVSDTNTFVLGRTPTRRATGLQDVVTHDQERQADVPLRERPMPELEVEIARRFQTLNKCRQFQETQQGRRQLWTSFNKAIEAGLEYMENVLTDPNNPSGERHRAACDDLQHWRRITWNKMENLIARDEDHVRRIESIAGSVSVFAIDHFL